MPHFHNPLVRFTDTLALSDWLMADRRRDRIARSIALDCLAGAAPQISMHESCTLVDVSSDIAEDRVWEIAATALAERLPAMLLAGPESLKAVARVDWSLLLEMILGTTLSGVSNAK